MSDQRDDASLEEELASLAHRYVGAAAALVVLATTASGFIWHVWGTRLLSDFWPLDRSAIAPNIVASAVQAVAAVGFLAAFYRPLQRRLGRAIKRHTDPIHAKIDHIIKYHPDIPDFPRGAVMSDPIPTRRAGKRGPHRESHEPRLQAHAFLAAGVTPVAGWSAFDATSGITDWGMDFNNELGCCGFAAHDHANVAKTGDAAMAGMTFSPKFQTLADAYFAYGIAQGEPGPHPDQGVSNADMLAWSYKQGFIDGYAEVPKDFACWFAAQFKGAITGQVLTDQAESDFEAHPPIPWGSPGETTDPEAGHDTLFVKALDDGTGETITWGGVQPFTADYWANNVTDVWVIFDRNDPFVNWDALEAALEAAHGTVNPVTPTPDPAPTATPSTGLVAAVEHLAKTLEEDVKRIAERSGQQAIVGFVTREFESLLAHFAHLK